MNFKVLEKMCLILFAFLISSCAMQRTSPFSTKDENAWFIVEEVDSGNSWPVYCMANKKETTAEPICFKSKTQGFEQPANKYRPKKQSDE